MGAPTLTPVEGNPFAPAPKRGAPVLTPVSGNPFSTGSALPKGRYGSGIEYEAAKLDPALRVTSRGRSRAANARVGGVADSAHLSDNARDFVPQGEPLDAAAARLRKGMPGYKVLVEGPGAAHSTGPHIHVEATGAAPVFAPKLTPVADDPFAPKPQAKPRPKLTPVRGNPHVAGWLDRIGSGVAAVENSAGKAFEAIPGSARRAAEGVIDSVRHPFKAAGAMSDLGLGAAEAGIRAVTGRDMAPKRGETPQQATARRAPHAAAFAPYQDAYGSAAGLQHKFETDPVGIALDASTVVGAGMGAARLARGAGEAGAVGRAASAASNIPRAAERYGDLQRATVGRHKLDASRAAAELQKHQRVIGNLPVEQQRAVVNAVESASKDGVAKLPEKHRPAAQAIRKVAQDYRSRIEQVMKQNGNAGPNFVEDYYARMWKQSPDEVRVAMAKQGSGRNLKARSIPTYEEGLERGLTPVHENPLDAMTAYVDNMSRYLATHDLQKGMRASGLAKWVPENAVPDGWMKLDGINTTRAGKGLSKEVKAPGTEFDGIREHTGDKPPYVLAAPKEAAVRYNAFVDPGLKANLTRKGLDKAATAVDAFGKTGNAMANVALTASGFHPSLIAGKAIGSDVATGLNHLFRGQFGDAAKSLAHAPFAPALTAREGFKMGDRLLTGDEAMTQIDRLWRDAGGRLTNTSTYHASLRPDFVTSALRGTGLRDIKDAFREVLKGSAGERAAATADLFSRTLDSFSSLVFKKYVPAIKRGVFEREMAAELKANPGLDEAGQRALARKVMDSVDGRMGELATDNMFWSQTRNDILRLALLSPSWQYGDIKAVVDAVKDMPGSLSGLVKGKGAQHGVAAAFGVASSYFLMNGIANYLHTGQAPQGEDWIAFRTGGVQRDAKGNEFPERAMVASMMKDFIPLIAERGANWTDELVNKMHPLPRELIELGTNRDWRGDPIFRPLSVGADQVPDNAPENMKGSRVAAALKHFGGQFMPFGLQPNPNGENSGIGGVEHTVLGIRPAGQRYYDPEGFDRWQTQQGVRAVKAKTRHDQAAERKKEKAQ